MATFFRLTNNRVINVDDIREIVPQDVGIEITFCNGDFEYYPKEDGDIIDGLLNSLPNRPDDGLLTLSSAITKLTATILAIYLEDGKPIVMPGKNQPTTVSE